MKKYHIKIYFCKIPLTEPYSLSFGKVDFFDTFVVAARNDEHIGLGEITPLPGYNHETVKSITNEIKKLSQGNGAGISINDLKKTLQQTAPFFLSGLLCALETSVIGYQKIYNKQIGKIPLSAFCGGENKDGAVQIARNLVQQGYKTLKMKVGQLDPKKDVNRIRGVAECLDQGMKIRLDANQGYSWKQALFLCKELEDLDCIELLEQPFCPSDWAKHERLAERVSIPIMLDESIWRIEDVKKAANCGAQYVKFKLCKHPGLNGSAEIIKTAKDLGLNIVYGNGVQTELGNHLESYIYKKFGLTTASENNGFLKMSDPLFTHKLESRNGMLDDQGVNIKFISSLKGECIFDEDIVIEGFSDINSIVMNEGLT